MLLQNRVDKLPKLPHTQVMGRIIQTTDSVIINEHDETMLLGRKRREKLFRFIGGKVDPTDTSLEQSSVREKNEEAGINLECSRPEYLGSFLVDDPRYRQSEDKMMTAVFLSYQLWGFGKAGDDIEEIQWFGIDTIKKNFKTMIVEEHYPIMELLIGKGKI